MGRLTTHVLDAAHGCPGSSIKVELYRVEGQQLELVNTALTNSDGRVDAPLLQGDDYRTGVYQLQLLPRPWRAIAGPGVSGCCRAALWHRRVAGALPRAAADLAVQLFDLSWKLVGR